MQSGDENVITCSKLYGGLGGAYERSFVMTTIRGERQMVTQPVSGLSQGCTCVGCQPHRIPAMSTLTQQIYQEVSKSSC
jgi:hypothetical protein